MDELLQKRIVAENLMMKNLITEMFCNSKEITEYLDRMEPFVNDILPCSGVFSVNRDVLEAIEKCQN